MMGETNSLPPARSVADIIAGQPVIVPGRANSVSIQADARSYEQAHRIDPVERWNFSEAWSWASSHFRVPRLNRGEWIINPRNWINLEGIRREYAGGEERAQEAVDEYRTTIDNVVNELAAQELSVDAALVRATMFMEVCYNPDVPIVSRLGESYGPMNVNYNVWGQLLARYGITEAQTLRDPETNIRAAAIILGTIDAQLVRQPDETPETRAARIASIYGNTEETLQHGVIPHGARVASIYVQDPDVECPREPIQQQESVQVPVITAAIARERTAGLAPA